MDLLPIWRITDNNPAFYDTTSGTVIEQTAKVYATMNTLISEYNSFAETINKNITDFVESTEKNYEAFAVGLRQEFQDFIDTVDLKIQSQDKFINDTLSTLSADIKKAATSIIHNMLINGEIGVGLYYNEDAEELSITAIQLDSENNVLYIADEEKIDIL